jgi:hypothetical protein
MMPVCFTHAGAIHHALLESFIRLPQKGCCVNLLGTTVTLGYLMQDILMPGSLYTAQSAQPSIVNLPSGAGKVLDVLYHALIPTLTILMANLQL